MISYPFRVSRCFRGNREILQGKYPRGAKTIIEARIRRAGQEPPPKIDELIVVASATHSIEAARITSLRTAVIADVVNFGRVGHDYSVVAV